MTQKNKKEKKQDPNILRVSAKPIILVFCVLFIVFELIFYLSFQGVNGAFYPFDLSFYIYTPILLAISIIFCFFSINQVFYKIDGSKITHYKLGKVYEYYFSDIIYVDEKWSLKHKMLLFYDRNGKPHYLYFDKQRVVYDKTLEKAKLWSKEEFHNRFPKVKI